MKNNTVFVLLLLIVLGGGYFLMSKSKPAPEIAAKVEKKVETEKSSATDKTFEVKGLNFAFDIKEIKVKLNDKVKINFTNTEGMHDFRIDELGAKTNIIKTGETDSLEFVASKVGTFEYYCSVGQHRTNGMWGKLIVE